MCKARCFKWPLTAVLLLLPAVARTEVQQIQPLSFGKIAIASNSSVSTTTVRRNGSQSSTHKIFIVQKGQPASIQLADFPIFTTIHLSAITPVTSSMPYGGSEQFTLTALDMPESIKTDNSGRANFYIGGTIATSGMGGSYFNGASYDLYIDLELSY
jgi:hypothetical protein